MKKRWKYRYRGMVLLALALVLAAGAGKAAAFPVLARGISGSGRNGRDTEEVVLTEDEQKIYKSCCERFFVPLEFPEGYQ